MDDFENELRRTLDDRAATVPESYDAPAEVVARVRRRRAVKRGALALSIVIVVSGSVAAVAGVVGRDDSKQVISTQLPVATTSTTGRITPPQGPGPAVVTRECPILAMHPGTPDGAPPSTIPRVVAGGDPARLPNLNSFAATDQSELAVLGPKTWSCQATFFEDGRIGIVVYPPAATPGRVPPLADSAIAVDDGWLWHGTIGAMTACPVFDDAAVVAHLTPSARNLLCPRPGRTVTRVNKHVATFVDRDGARGAGWLILPSDQQDNGQIRVLTCRPTDGLTRGDCDTIIADWLARMHPID